MLAHIIIFHIINRFYYTLGVLKKEMKFKKVELKNIKSSVKVSEERIYYEQHKHQLCSR